MLSIRFYNISVFIVPYKEFAEKNGSPIIELYLTEAHPTNAHENTNNKYVMENTL
jgi:hypothetical protein